MKNRILNLVLVLIIATACSTKPFIPSIEYVKNNEITEVRITLPNGESKIIYKINKPVFETGIKTDLTTEGEQLFGDSEIPKDSCELVNTSFAFESGTKHLFYIYKHKTNEKTYVYRLQIGEAGIEDSVIVFEGLLSEEKGDSIESSTELSDLSEKKEYTLVYERKEDMGTRILHSKLEIIIKGTTATFKSSRNDGLTSSQNAVIRGNEIYVEGDESPWEFINGSLCQIGEGDPEPYCYYFNESQSNVTFKKLKNFENSGYFDSEENGGLTNNKTFNEIQLELTDASLKKAKLYLGEPDVFESTIGHITKGFAVYYNMVSNNGSPKHLVLFLRWQQGNSNPEIEEIYSVSDGEKACFGIHCIKIIDGEIYTNALDLIHDKGYKSLN